MGAAATFPPATLGSFAAPKAPAGLPVLVLPGCAWGSGVPGNRRERVGMFLLKGDAPPGLNGFGGGAGIPPGAPGAPGIPGIGAVDFAI
jgi:hypothetical protein